MENENIEEQSKMEEGDNIEINETTEELRKMAESAERQIVAPENAADPQKGNEEQQLRQARADVKKSFENELHPKSSQEYPDDIRELGDRIIKDTEEIERQKEESKFGFVRDAWKEIVDFWSGKTKARKERFKKYVEYVIEIDLMDDEDIRMMEDYKLTPEQYRTVDKYMSDQRAEGARREHPERFDPETGKPLSLKEQGFSATRFFLRMKQKDKK